MDTNRETDIGRWVDERLATLVPAKNWQPNAIRGLAVLQAKQRAGVRSVQHWTWAVAAVSAVCLSAIAFPASRVLAQRCLNYCSTALRQSAGEPGSARTNLKPEIGEVAPDFTLTDLSGKPVRLSDFRGKVILVNFWATWCQPCKIEIPWLIEFNQKYGPKGLVILGVAMDDEGKKAVEPFVQKQQFTVNGQPAQMNYPILLGSDKIADKFGGLIGLPTSMLYSRDGKKIKTIIGLINYDDLSKALQSQL
jgi:thiol-disulfide isomerase/thioredoxin